MVTACEDQAHELQDPGLLDRATEMGRVLVTHDEDFLVEAVRRLREGVPFSGVFFAHFEQATSGEFVRDLELAAKVLEPEEMKNQIEYFPL